MSTKPETPLLPIIPPFEFGAEGVRLIPLDGYHVLHALGDPEAVAWLHSHPSFVEVGALMQPRAFIGERTIIVAECIDPALRCELISRRSIGPKLARRLYRRHAAAKWRKQAAEAMRDLAERLRRGEVIGGDDVL